jgi:MFS family permease
MLVPVQEDRNSPARAYRLLGNPCNICQQICRRHNASNHRLDDIRPAPANAIFAGFVIQGFFSGALAGLAPCYLTERFPTEVRTTAIGFCYHVGTAFASFVPPALSYAAVEWHMGYAIPMLIGTLTGSASAIVALIISPETKVKCLLAS